jgi:hypothetical protein
MRTLASRPVDSPLPTGVGLKKRGADVGGVVWPGAENWIYPGDGSGGNIGTVRRPERFWLHAGASFIIYNAAASGWERFDYQLRLCVNGPSNYGNDLNGINFFQKASSSENHPNPWWGMSIAATFFCEADTDYDVYLLSKSSSPDIYYGQWGVHYNLWSYTIGEGVY